MSNSALKSKVFEIGQLIIYQKFQTGPILTVELGNSVIFGKVCKINTLGDSLKSKVFEIGQLIIYQKF